MSTKTLVKNNDLFPAVFNDFFKPWNEWFTNGDMPARLLTVPAVNVAENKSEYSLTLAAPGLKKNDFTIDVEGNLLTISCEKSDSKEENDARHTRREYNFSSFSRSFTLPEEVLKNKIAATYEDGVLKLTLPKTEEAKKTTLQQHIPVK